MLALEGDDGQKRSYTMFLAGFLSGAGGFLLSTPLWQIKTRMQAQAGLLDTHTGLLKSGVAAGRPPDFRGVGHGLAVLAHRGGAFRGATPLVVRGALLSGGQQLGYDGTKTIAKSEGWVQDGVVLHVGSSVVAALLGVTLSAPFDVLLTHYQAGRPCGAAYSSLWSCAQTLAKNEGPLVVFKGWMPYFARVAPLFVFNLPLYEQIRCLFGLGFME